MPNTLRRFGSAFLRNGGYIAVQLGGQPCFGILQSLGASKKTTFLGTEWAAAPGPEWMSKLN